MILIDKWLKFRHGAINKANQLRLVNKNMTIISINCAGGFLYRWLGLEFKSPFPEYSSAFFVKNYEDVKNGKVNTIWRTQNVLTGKRYIDQFDYVAFFNKTEATS